MGGDFVTVRSPASTTPTFTELAEAPVAYADGRNNNWWNSARRDPPPLSRSARKEETR